MNFLTKRNRYCSAIASMGCLPFLASGCSAAPKADEAPLPFAIAQNVLWQDGKTASAPRGRLLSDNLGYFGETIPTGVKYKYPTRLNKQMDILRSDATNFGRRLLNGEMAGDETYVPVIMEGAPLVVEFDFKQSCTITEIDVADTRDKAVSIDIVTRSTVEEEWTKVASLSQSVGKVHRLIFEQPVKAQYIRLTANSGASTTTLDEVWVWGDAKPVVEPDARHGILPEMRADPELKDADFGDATILDAAKLADWRKSSGFAQNALTWQVAPSPWQMLDRQPLKGAFLPGKTEVKKPVTITATRNEGEPAALFLVNASDKPQDVIVELSKFRKVGGAAESSIEGKLSVAGAIWTRRWGQTLRPLFSAENKLGGAYMEKYLTNGSTIKDFPQLHLPAGGTAMLWLTVHTKNTVPGKYQASIKYGSQTIPVQLEVLPVTLPYPNVWSYQWNEVSQMTPFRTADALRNEVQYMQQDLGITVWSELPEKGTDAELARTLEKEYSGGTRKTYYRFRPAIHETNLGYMGTLEGQTFDATFRSNVSNQINTAVAQAKALGLDYDDYSFELWDEPWAKNIKSFAALTKLIKEINPEVRVLANPLFWGGKGSSPDSEQVGHLEGWYNETVDISIPILPNLNAKLFPKANAEYYDHPRFVRAMYMHPSPGRAISWEAFKRGYNGWGTYAYYRLRGDAWNDFDTYEFDFQIVYPGPHGAIPTIESEVMRESWDDYRLLSLLKTQQKTAVLQQLIARFEKEVPPAPDEQDWQDGIRRGVQANKTLPELRAIALKAVSQP